MAEEQKFRSKQLKEVYLTQLGNRLQRWTAEARRRRRRGYSANEIEAALVEMNCPGWDNSSQWKTCSSQKASRRVLSEETLHCIRRHFSAIDDLDVKIEDADRLAFYEPDERLSYFLLREIDLDRDVTLWAEISKRGSQQGCSAELLASMLIAVEWFGVNLHLVCRTKSYLTAYLLIVVRQLAMKSENGFSWKSVWEASEKVEGQVKAAIKSRKAGKKVKPFPLESLTDQDFQWFGENIKKFNSRFDSSSNWYEFITSSPISYFLLDYPERAVAYFSLSERNFVRDDALPESEDMNELIRRYELVRRDDLFYQPNSEDHWRSFSEFQEKITKKAVKYGFLFGEITQNQRSSD